VPPRPPTSRSDFKKAVIVAAGMGRRLGATAGERPKALLEVGGATLIERSIHSLREAGVADITVVTGFGKEQIENCLGASVEYRENPFFAMTNNMASLWLAQSAVVHEPFVYLHADIIYDAEILARCLATPASGMAVDCHPCADEEMKVSVAAGMVERSDKGIPAEKAHGEWVGIACFDGPTGDALFAEIERQLAANRAYDAYDTAAFNQLVREGHRLSMVDCTGLPWTEIDFPEDLARAQQLFSTPPAGSKP
jgi:L-glutamine-phosphate cytidylyltransferase